MLHVALRLAAVVCLLAPTAASAQRITATGATFAAYISVTPGTITIHTSDAYTASGVTCHLPAGGGPGCAIHGADELYIDGLESADEIVVSDFNDPDLMMLIDANGGPDRIYVVGATAGQLRVKGGAGADEIKLGTLSGAPLLVGAEMSMTVDAGTADVSNTVLANVHVWGNLTLFGSRGADHVMLEGAALKGEGGHGSIFVRTFNGDDTVELGHLSAHTTARGGLAEVTVRTGRGDDQIHVVGDTIIEGGAVRLYGEDGADELVVAGHVSVESADTNSDGFFDKHGSWRALGGGGADTATITGTIDPDTPDTTVELDW